MDQRFLIPMPLAEKPAADGGGLGIYIDTEGKRLYWSASFPLPKIAERVIVTINRIGASVITGYFAEAGYLGVMALPDSPPEYLRRQRLELLAKSPREALPQWILDGVCCLFGAEIASEDRL